MKVIYQKSKQLKAYTNETYILIAKTNEIQIMQMNGR